MNEKRKIALLLVVALLTMPLYGNQVVAQPPETADPLLLSNLTLGNSDNAAVALSSSGVAIVVWQQGDGSPYSIWASTGSASGSWSPARALETDGANALSPEASIDDSGWAIASWVQLDGATWRLRGAHMPAGMQWNAPEWISPQGGANVTGANLSNPRGGSLTIVWTEDQALGEEVWARTFIADTGWSSAHRLDTGNTESRRDARIFGMESGAFVATWTEGPPGSSSIWVARRASTGSWDSPTRLNLSATGFDEDASLCTDAAGQENILWVHVEAGSGQLIAANLGPTNQTLDGKVVSTAGAGTIRSAHMACGPAGEVVVAWEERINGTWNPFGAALSSYRPPLSKVNLGVGFQNATSGTRLSGDSDGNAMAAWAQVDDGAYRVWASSYVYGRGWSTPFALANASVGYSARPALASSGAAGAAVTWTQHSGSTTGVFVSVTEPVPLSVETPEPDSVVVQSPILVTGWAGGTESLQINGIQRSPWNDGWFSTAVDLNPGVNRIVVLAETSEGTTRSVVIDVTFFDPVENLSARVDELAADLSLVAGALTSIMLEVGNATFRIVSLETEVTSLSNDVLAGVSDRGVIHSSLQNISAKLSDESVLLSQLANQLEDVERELGDVNSSLAAAYGNLSASIVSLQTVIDANNVRIATLSGRLDNMASEVANLSVDNGSYSPNGSPESGFDISIAVAALALGTGLAALAVVLDMRRRGTNGP